MTKHNDLKESVQNLMVDGGNVLSEAEDTFPGGPRPKGQRGRATTWTAHIDSDALSDKRSQGFRKDVQAEYRKGIIHGHLTSLGLGHLSDRVEHDPYMGGHSIVGLSHVDAAKIVNHLGKHYPTPSAQHGRGWDTNHAIMGQEDTIHPEHGDLEPTGNIMHPGHPKGDLNGYDRKMHGHKAGPSGAILGTNR